MNKYGQRIKLIRKKRGISQVKLAEILGVDPSHICRIEKGKGTCSILLLQRIATALGVKVSELLEEQAS
ncbi:helix-turn-helix domain-containing protein [Desulfoscipio gibsoniae]